MQLCSFSGLHLYATAILFVFYNIAFCFVWQANIVRRNICFAVWMLIRLICTYGFFAFIITKYGIKHLSKYIAVFFILLRVSHIRIIARVLQFVVVFLL